MTLISCTEEKKGIKPQYRKLTEAVYSTAVVEPRISYQVYAPVSGIIESIKISEGDLVSKDQLIVKISNAQSQLNIENAQLKYEISKENYEGRSTVLKEIKEQIKTAQVSVLNDSINYDRQLLLWQQGIGSLQEKENKQLIYDIAVNELKRLNNSYLRSQKELKQQIEIAKNNLKINKLNQQDFNVQSKLDGVVYSVLKEIGESVSPQNAIAIIGSENDFILTLLIDEVDIAKIELGQNILISLDAFPGKTFNANISKVYPEKDQRSLTFKVEAEFKTLPKRLLKGLSGEANIIISERENILTIPTQYINNNQQINTSNGIKKISIGTSSISFTEIISGLDSSTVIYLHE